MQNEKLTYPIHNGLEKVEGKKKREEGRGRGREEGRERERGRFYCN